MVPVNKSTFFAPQSFGGNNLNINLRMPPPNIPLNQGNRMQFNSQPPLLSQSSLPRFPNGSFPNVSGSGAGFVRPPAPNNVIPFNIQNQVISGSSYHPQSIFVNQIKCKSPVANKESISPWVNAPFSQIPNQTPTFQSVSMGLNPEVLRQQAVTNLQLHSSLPRFPSQQLVVIPSGPSSYMPNLQIQQQQFSTQQFANNVSHQQFANNVSHQQFANVSHQQFANNVSHISQPSFSSNQLVLPFTSTRELHSSSQNPFISQASHFNNQTQRFPASTPLSIDVSSQPQNNQRGYNFSPSIVDSSVTHESVNFGGQRHFERSSPRSNHAKPYGQHMSSEEGVGNSNRSQWNSNGNFENRNDYNKDNMSKAWMTDEILSEIKKKNALYAQAKASGDSAEWEAFKDQRAKIGLLIAKSMGHKKSFENIACEKNQNVTKPYYCDTCDRGFATNGELQEHNSQHVQCDAVGCQFYAHSKVVALHKKMQHDTGYAKVIYKAQDEEEIRKWREERKKRFPTAKNILKRKAEMQEKEARGEVIENKEFGKFKKQRNDTNQRATGGFKSRNNYKNHRQNKNFQNKNFKGSSSIADPIKISNSDSESDDDSHIKLHKFKGMKHGYEKDKNEDSRLEMNNIEEPDRSPYEKHNKDHVDILSGSFSQRDTSMQNESVVELTEPIPQSNISMIDISDEDESIMPVAKTVEVGINKKETTPSRKLVTYDDNNSEDDAPVEIPILKTPGRENDGIENKKAPMHLENNKEDQPNQRVKGRDFSNKRKKEHNTSQVPRKSTLLEELLADDIRHERNVIMQCVRYVVQNDFFGIGRNQ